MREIAQRELRNDVGAVLRAVEAGERLIVTVDRRPVAMLSPIPKARTWLPAHEVERHVRRADPGLREELRSLLGDTVEDL